MTMELSSSLVKAPRCLKWECLAFYFLLQIWGGGGRKKKRPFLRKLAFFRAAFYSSLDQILLSNVECKGGSRLE